MANKKKEKKLLKRMERKPSKRLVKALLKSAPFVESLQPMIDSRVEERLSAQAATGGVDSDDANWRPLSRSRRDLTPVEQDRLIRIANFLVRANPIASRAVQVRRDFVLGEGVKFEAEDKEKIQPIIDEFTADPVNNWDEFQFQLADGLGTNGELFVPTFVNEGNALTRLGWIDPEEVQSVIRDKFNRRIMRNVILKGVPVGDESFTQIGNRRYNIINVDTVSLDKTRNLRVGNIFHFRINCSPDATRGRSDLESVADYLDSFDQGVFNEIERGQLIKNFIWDVMLEGMKDGDIEKWLTKQQPPAPGSIRAHNEKVTWKAEAPELKVSETISFHEFLLKVILGALGLSSFYFGITEGANKASSQNLDTPILKGLLARQRILKAVFREIIDYAIDQKALRDNGLRFALQSKKISRKFDIVMPEISMKDVMALSSAINQMVAAVTAAQQERWITRARGAQIFAAQVQQVGIEYDAEEERKLAEAEGAKEDAEDYKNNPPPDFNKDAPPGDPQPGKVKEPAQAAA